MKICPTCRRTYPDDSLNYCLDDGSVLTAAPVSGEAETVFMNRPSPTSTAQPAATASPVPGLTMPTATQPRQGRSRAWLWSLLILGVLMLLCGGGFAGAFWWVSQQKSENADLKIQDQTPDTPDTPNTPDNWNTDNDADTKPGLTMEKYRQIKNGMTYKEVVAILGSEGKVLSDSSGGGTRYATYQWSGDNFEMIVLSFQNDKLNSKTQVGLASSSSDSKESAVSREKYDRLKDGMSYREVVSVLGGEGEEQFNSNIAGFKIATYQWKGSGYSSIIITFQDDKLQSKSQVGL